VAFFQANDWNRNALKAIKDNLEKYGYAVNVIDGNGDAAKMNAAIDTHIANKVDGIIIAGGDGTALKSGAQHIVDAGIPYTVIDMFQEGAITNVMADNWGGGTQLGLYVVNQTGGKGKVLILDTPSRSREGYQGNRYNLEPAGHWCLCRPEGCWKNPGCGHCKW
jgi:ribose transport system substrate-binding protein